MTKILKKSLACLLVFALCFTAIASCLAVSAAAPAMSVGALDLYVERPSNPNSTNPEVCEGERIRLQVGLGDLEAGSTIGISVLMPEGVELGDIAFQDKNWDGNRGKIEVVSQYLDTETRWLKMVLKVTSNGDNIFFWRFNATANIPKDQVFNIYAVIEAANTSAAGDDNLFYKETTKRPMRVMLNHNETEIAGKDATCEEAGLTAGSKCSRCEKVLVEQEEIKALGHAYEGVANPDSTCNSEGTMVYTCKNDPSHTYTEAISKKDHTPAADLVNNGDNHSVVCDVCKAVISTADHEYVDGTCACGAKKPAEIVPQEDASIVVRDAGIMINATLDMRVRVKASVIPKDCARAELIVTPTIYDSKYNTTPGEVFVKSFDMSVTTGNLIIYPKNFSLYALDLPMYVQIKCYDANDNLYKYSPTYTYYPAERLKAEYKADATATDKKALNRGITDLLNMSAAAQVFFAGNASAGSALKNTVESGNLVNKDWPQDYATTTTPNFNTVDSKDFAEGYNNTSHELRIGIDLSGAPILSYSLRKASTLYPDRSKLTMTISYTTYYGKAAGGEVISDTITGSEWDQYVSGNHLVYKFKDCAMYDGNKTVTVVVNYDGVDIVTSQYSLESYIAANTADDSNLSKGLKAMGIFGASARAYFATQGVVDPA